LGLLNLWNIMLAKILLATAVVNAAGAKPVFDYTFGAN